MTAALTAFSGGDVRVGELEVAQPGRVLALKAEGLLVVALEHGDEEGERQESVGAQLEQLHIVVRGERLPLLVVEG